MHAARKAVAPEPAEEFLRAVGKHHTGERDAHVRITVYFADRSPVGPYSATVGARRTRHLRFNELEDPEPVPRGTPFASVIECDVPIVVQHTRLDSRQAENALMTTMAFPCG